MKVLSVSDAIVPFIYSGQARHFFEGIDLVFGCGDLAYYYLEFVLTVLNAPLFYVRGNHDKVVEYSGVGQRTAPAGGFDLHRRVVEHNGWLLAGVEGSLRYRPGQFQYSQSQMWGHVFSLVPRLLLNRMRYGRYLDVFVTHAPSWGVNDREDLPHQGIKAFRWLLKVFEPAYHFHGHVHLYRPDDPRVVCFGDTQVINSYRYITTALDRKQCGAVQPADEISAA